MIQRLADITTDATAAFEKESKRLLVRWDDNLLLFALADTVSGQWQAAEILKYSKEENDSEHFITELKQKSTLVSFTGLQTVVFVSTPQSVLIPKELEEGADLFIKTQFGIKEGSQIFTNEVNEKMIAGFLIEEERLAIIQKLFPQAEVKSSLGLLVNQALFEATANDAILLLYVGKTTAELAIVQEGQLLLARCFSFTANEDVLYHLLNACRVFDISPLFLQLVLQGQEQEQDDIYQLLKTYFANLHFAKATAVLQHPAFTEVPSHYFTPLIQPL